MLVNIISHSILSKHTIGYMNNFTKLTIHTTKLTQKNITTYYRLGEYGRGPTSNTTAKQTT